jgi:hypothetical protein
MKLHTPMSGRVGARMGVRISDTRFGLRMMGPVTSAICLYSAEKLITSTNLKPSFRKWSGSTPLRILVRTFIVYRLFEHIWGEVLEDVLEDINIS